MGNSRFETYTSYAQILNDSVARYPDREAIIYEDWRISYGEFGRYVNQTAHYLIGRGIGPGTPVAIISRNCPEWLIAEFALYSIGAIVVKINWRSTPKELAYMLDLNEVHYVFYKPEKPEWRAELQERYADRLCFLPFCKDELLRAIADEPETYPDSHVDREMVSCHLHTSGTTGYPKCVVHTHGAMLEKIRNILDIYPYPPGQKYQYISQLFHAAAIGAHLLLTTGGTMILMPQFVLDKYVKSLQEEQVEAISVVPTVLKWILDDMDKNGYTLPALKNVFYSTCPIPPALLQRALDKLHCNFYQSYGMTEMCSIMTVLTPEDHRAENGKYLKSVGRPIAGVQIKVFRKDGSVCDPNERGIIYAKGSGRLKEYYKLPEVNRKNIVQGWFRTNDMGYMDEAGYLYLDGRADDLIISGGENIYPGEITNVIMQLYNDVSEVAVYGVPDEVWGEHVKASVVLLPGSQLTEEALKQYCRENMPTFRAPKEIEFLPELPKNATGKIVISQLKAKAAK